ncbi:hypothetical protein [Nocardia brasiliensis]|uniref:hypothetical protein n=1 Tax=Nocardia brasiliensis TaxID=37326 RepID=UPI002453CD07|nr:hypothetical protein [Nocardia brasiliensis]
MRYNEYRTYDAVGLAELVAKGEVQPAELLQVALDRCAQVDPGINAVSLLMAEAGRAGGAPAQDAAGAGERVLEEVESVGVEVG